MLKALQNSLFSVIYPQECSICSRQVVGLDTGVACARCWADTTFIDGSEMLCEKCGALLGDKAAPSAVFCRRCDDHHYDAAIAVGIYENALAACLLNLKKVPHLPMHLRDAIRGRLKTLDLSGTDLMIPIPLSKQRQHERGFNQADVIAEHISALTGIKIDRISLARKLHTPAHRIGMDQRGRELTVVRAFEVIRPKLIEGRSVLLIDDILTSGSTASSCAKVLKKNGAARVNVFTLARAVMR
jgi:ComF family protein